MISLFIGFFLLFNLVWSNDDSRLRVEEENCKKGKYIVCYGSKCVTGNSICLQNPCPNCNDGDNQE